MLGTVITSRAHTLCAQVPGLELPSHFQRFGLISGGLDL
jgi:hypothetical protein